VIERPSALRDAAQISSLVQQPVRARRSLALPRFV